MTISRSNPRAKQRWGVLAFLVAALTIALAASSLAVHDNGKFELDKNATNDLNVTLFGTLGANVSGAATATTIPVCQTATTTPTFPFTILVEAERMSVTAVAGGSFGGNCAGTKVNFTVTRGFDGTTRAAHSKSGVNGNVSLVQTATKDGPDWNQVHSALQSDPDSSCAALGLVECSFVSDQIGPTTFIGGASKDHLPINGWMGTSGASPDKAEILNAYAAKAVETDGDQVLYFGMDRYAVDGSTDIGFWFFKNPVTFDESTGVFTGEHAGTLTTPGDILILGTFTQGGATTNVRVFRWVGEGGNESGTVNGPDGDFGDCIQDPPLTNDNGCATVNNTSIEVPWTYTFKGSSTGGWVPAGGFYEGGVNLTAIGLDGCFSSFLAETRSSPEITAILKDFALGSFEACDSGLTTTPSDDNGDPIGEDGISIGTGSVLVRDSADLNITGTSEWEGSLDFYLCGPDEGLCDDSGTLISSHDIDQDSEDPFLSDAAEVTSAGEYCWAAFFTSDTVGVPDAEDATEGECFTVNPVTPTITTEATSTVVLGNEIDDVATLSGTANQPGDPVIDPTTAGGPANGTITFSLYGPSDTAVCTAENLIGTSVVDVSGDSTLTNVYRASDGTVTGTLEPPAVGTYYWIAVYSGDPPNTNDAEGECGDDGETTTVTGTADLSTAQDWLPNDTATLTGDTNLNGTLTFVLYDDGTCGDDDGTAVYTEDPITVTNAASGSTFSTTNDSFVVKEADSGSYSWLVTYTDDVLDSPDPVCEVTDITITD